MEFHHSMTVPQEVTKHAVISQLHACAVLADKATVDLGCKIRVLGPGAE